MTQTTEQPSASPSAAPDSGSFEVLPGVMGETPSSEASSNAPAPADAVAGGEAAVSNSAAVQTPPDPSAVPTPEKFQFAGLEFESREKAEHSVKTLRGMHRALERKAEQARIERLEEQSRRLQLEQELASLRNPAAGASPTKPNGQPAGDQAAEEDGEPDWRLFDVLEEKHGRATAMRWLHATNKALLQKQLQSEIDSLEARFEERLAPLNQTYAEQRELNETAELFQSLAIYRTPDGREAYPELKDEKAMERVGQTWKRMGLPRDYLLTPKGLHAAIAIYRDAVAMQAASVGSGSGASATTSQAPPASPLAAATAVGNGADGPTPTRPPKPMSEGEQMRAEIMAAAVSSNELGFS